MSIVSSNDPKYPFSVTVLLKTDTVLVSTRGTLPIFRREAGHSEMEYLYVMGSNWQL